MIVTQNSKFLCGRRERKKESKLASDYINALLRTALINVFLEIKNRISMFDNRLFDTISSLF